MIGIIGLGFALCAGLPVYGCKTEVHTADFWVLFHSAIDLYRQGKQVAPTSFTLMNKPEISIRQLAEAYVDAGRELLGYTGRAVFQPSGEAAYLTDNPQRRCPDIAKARQVLGYEPKIMVEDGLRRYLRFLVKK